MNNKNKTIEQQEDFDKRFENQVGYMFRVRKAGKNSLKQFILSEKAKSFKEGFEKNEMVLGKAHELGFKEGAQSKFPFRTRIGMLRQWLNEDRIKDVDKFVTNEQIEFWLGLREQNKG